MNPKPEISSVNVLEKRWRSAIASVHGKNQWPTPQTKDCCLLCLSALDVLAEGG